MLEQDFLLTLFRKVKWRPPAYSEPSTYSLHSLSNAPSSSVFLRSKSSPGKADSVGNFPRLSGAIGGKHEKAFTWLSQTPFGRDITELVLGIYFDYLDFITSCIVKCNSPQSNTHTQILSESMCSCIDWAANVSITVDWIYILGCNNLSCRYIALKWKVVHKGWLTIASLILNKANCKHPPARQGCQLSIAALVSTADWLLWK